MGVEAFFYSYDEAWFSSRHVGPLDIDVLMECGAVDRESEVTPPFRARLEAIDTFMTANKQWYNNLAGDTVYARVRRWLPEARRAALDEVFQLLFWDAETLDGLPPSVVPRPSWDADSSCYVYPARTVAWLAAQDPVIEDIRPYFEAAMEDFDRSDQRWLRNLDDFDTFQWWVDAWLTVMPKAVAGHPEPRALLVFVWY